MSTINKHELQELTAKAAVVQLTSVEQRRLQNLVAEAEGHDSTDPEHREQKYNRAFRHFLSTGAGLSQFSFDRSDGLGKDVLTLAERSILRAREISASNMYLDSESRDMAEGSGAYSIGSMGGAYSGSTSGYFASLEFNSQVTSALRSYGGVLSEAALIDAPDGRIRAYPTDSDATASGEMLTEGRQTTQQDLSINQILVGAYKFSSKCLKISRELCADSGIDLQSYLTERLGIRLARTMNDRFTNGLGGGNSEPNGLIHSSPIGAVAVGSASNTGGAEVGGNSIGSDDLIALERSVDPAYRDPAFSKYMLHSDTLALLKTVKDKTGRPIWISGISTGGRDSLNGYALTINNDMQSLTADRTPNSPPVALRSVAFGRFDKYVIKRAPMVVYVMLERFALEGQVGYLCLQRADGAMLDSNAVKVLVNVY